jgi:hypothetical protein
MSASSPERENYMLGKIEVKRLRNKVNGVVLFLSALLLLGACGSESSQSNLEHNTQTNQTEEKEFLYESQVIKVTETPGWKEDKNTSSNDKVNVMFQNGNVKAIVTMVSNEKSLEEIKNELKTAFGSAKEIEESDLYVAFKSNREESIRADIYLNRGDEQTGILIFMTPLQEFGASQPKIEEFKNNVQYF